jgi:hypothetical protein
MGNVLVVAFDGLDEELIEKFNLEEIKQSEIGTIDNKTGMNEIMTSELFTSFITGHTSEVHGISGLKLPNSYAKKKLIDKISSPVLTDKFPGYYRLQKAVSEILDYKTYKPDSSDYDEDTLFEKIIDSKALFVPGYNPSWFWRINADLEPLREGATIDETAQHYEREFEFRKKKLFEELENEYNFLMCHFHKIDTMQHLYGGQKGKYNEERLRGYYEEIDDFAGEIKQKADYDTIIFMSDHGIPDLETNQHNENAFYSCNHELFGDKTPHITDFHNKILDLVSDKNQINNELSGIDI